MSFYQDWIARKHTIAQPPNNKWSENERHRVGWDLESDYLKEQRKKALAYLGSNHVTAKNSTFTKSWRDF